MKIVATFEKNWSIAEVEDYIRNPNAEKYTELPYDLHLELVACAEYYATEHYCADGEDVEVDQHAMNESAALSIASGIEEYFFSDMYENYYEYYVLQTAARLDKTHSERYAKALRLSVPECTLITPTK